MNDRQEAFCREYLKDLRPEEAYVRAGYSRRGARQSAHRLLTDADVQARVAELKAERVERLEADADLVLQDLLELHSTDIRDYFDEEGRLRPIQDLSPAAARALRSFDVVETDRGSAVKVRMVDRLRLLELIGKHVGVGAWEKEARPESQLPLVIVRDYTGAGTTTRG